MAEKVNTKQQILEVALDYFSVKGFEATSISMIVDAVGIRKASLYSHFKSKQEILDTLMAILYEEFDQNSIYTKANWKDPSFTAGKENLTAHEVAEIIKRQVRYVVHDPHISKVRKMLLIEQFQNSELSQYYTKQSYTDVFKYNQDMMEFFISKGILKNEDPQIMAAQFAFPISTWISLLDREEGKEEEVMELIEKHVKQFFNIYHQ